MRGPVTSPTFVLARTHPSLVGGPPLVHVDAYRLGSAARARRPRHRLRPLGRRGRVGQRDARRRRRVVARGRHRAADRRAGASRSPRCRRGTDADELRRDPPTTVDDELDADEPRWSIAATARAGGRRRSLGWSMLLAIDTSAGTSVAVVDRDGGVLAERTRNRHDAARRGRSATLIDGRAAPSRGVAVAALSGVVAGMGPGRSPASGSASPPPAPSRSAPACPLVPVVSHDAIAFERYAAGHERPAARGHRRAPPRGLLVGLRRASTTRACRCGTTARAGQARRAARPPADSQPASTPRIVSAGALGMLAELALAHGGRFAADEPLYLRSPDVTLSAGPKRVTRDRGSCAAPRPPTSSAIMELERATFPTDAWSERLMRSELGRAHGTTSSRSSPSTGADRRLRRGCSRRRARGRRHPDDRVRPGARDTASAVR